MRWRMMACATALLIPCTGAIGTSEALKVWYHTQTFTANYSDKVHGLTFRVEAVISINSYEANRIWLDYYLAHKGGTNTSGVCEIPAEALYIGPSGKATLNTESLLGTDCDGDLMPHFNLTAEPSPDLPHSQSHANSVREWRAGDGSLQREYEQETTDSWQVVVSGSADNELIDPLLKYGTRSVESSTITRLNPQQ